MGMTESEIMKALECHKERDVKSCGRCPLLNIDGCVYKLSENALDLLNRKNAEIEEKTKRLREVLPIVQEIRTEARAEAIKEFAERVKGIIEQIVSIIFDDNESKCRIKGCRYPSNIPCGNEICLEENKAFWKAEVDQIAKEMWVEL